jgi:competence protein ComFC
MVVFDPKTVHGPWDHGVVLDIHTTRSVPTGPNAAGYMQFETDRTPLGELLHRLKYRADRSVVPEIVAAAVAFLRPHRGKFDLIVPVPPSQQRALQPVAVLAEALGVAPGVKVEDSVARSHATKPQKEVDDPSERLALLSGLYTVVPGAAAAKNVLLFDDAYRSGATLSAITGLLREPGKAASVRVLAITRTRSHR